MSRVSYSLEEIAREISAELKGDPHCCIDRAEPLAGAKSGAITFLANRRYRSYLINTQASAVILRVEEVEHCPVNTLICENPELAFSRLLHLLYPPLKQPPGIHLSAVIGEHCQIDPTAFVGPHCVIEDRVRIGANTVIGSGCVIGADSRIGSNCHLYSRVSIYKGVTIGERVIIHSGAVLGADGFGFAQDGGQWIKILQIGGVRIGNDVEIGANSTIDRGALQDTVIGNGVKIDNLVQIAHNVKIGDYTAIAACVGIAGSAEIGRHCMLGGAVVINGHIKISDGVILTGASTVGQSITEPGVYSSGVNVQKNSLWRRNTIRFHQLDDMSKRLHRLEKLYKVEEKQDGTNEY